jgi:hypothetical protein
MGMPTVAVSFSDGRLDGTMVGTVDGRAASAEATTARNCFRSTGFVR